MTTCAEQSLIRFILRSNLWNRILEKSDHDASSAFDMHKLAWHLSASKHLWYPRLLHTMLGVVFFFSSVSSTYE